MKFAPSRRVAGISAIGALALTLAACGDSASGDGDGTTGGDETSQSTELTGTIAGSGASSQENAVQGWVAGFMEANPGATVTYDPTGSGTGREQFINGTVQFAGSDAALDADELAAAQERCGDGDVLELPLYISPIAVVYNIPELNDTNINLSPDTIADIFTGEITNWNDPAIAESNEGVELPDLEIVPVNRSDDSGTTENFTEYLAAAAPDAWPHEPSGLWPIEGTQSGAQTSGLMGVVEGAEGTIGYVDASRVGDLGTVAVGVGEEFVPFSPEAAARVIDVSEPAADASETLLTIELARDTQESGAYPIVLVSYSIACATYDNAEHADLVRGYFSYIASEEGQERAAQPDVAGSAPISDDLRERAMAAIEMISAG